MTMAIAAPQTRKPDRRTEVADLTDELTALRAECADFATEVLALASRAHTALANRAPALALNEIGRIGHLAGRHIRQRDGAA